MTSLALAPSTLTRPLATRFLQRATFGARPGDVDTLIDVGIDAWIDQQMAMPVGETHHQRRVGGTRFASSIWQSYLSGPDQLRTRVAYALSQIFVVSDVELSDRDVAVFADVLDAHCFGDYRTLLEAISRSAAMGRYLTYDRNRRADERRGTVPDENYAREILQLFSIGLWELHPDGTRRTDGRGAPIPTYDTDDIIGLARVFTGFDPPRIDGDNERYALPMISDGLFAERYHEREEKRFLGTTIPRSDTRTLDESLRIALDTIAAHPNVGPFLGRQLIQRLVTSNPSSAYVGRIAGVWANDGAGQRGNLGAVIRAILTDDEAWPTTPGASFGKLREPTLRFTTVARALGATTTALPWPIDSLSDQPTELSQQPFESPSVFNFYRPGYVPPQSVLGDAGLVSPEMQLANETTAIGWVNYLARFLRRPPGRIYLRGEPGEYAAQVALDLDELIEMIASRTVTIAQARALVDELAARLCPAGVSSAVRNIAVRVVVDTFDERYTDGATEEHQVRRRNEVDLDRVAGAATVIAASTDFLWER